MDTCIVDGCDKPRKISQYCGPHYHKWWRYGDPTVVKRASPDTPLIDRFMRFVDKDHPGGCWVWAGTKTPKGYGHFGNKHGVVIAHRWSYEYHVGPIPDGLEIDHLCSNRACVNPAHLEVVTHAENNRRTVARRGPRTHCSKGHALTDDNVYVFKTGARACKICDSQRHKESYARRMARATPS